MIQYGNFNPFLFIYIYDIYDIYIYAYIHDFFSNRIHKCGTKSFCKLKHFIPLYSPALLPKLNYIKHKLHEIALFDFFLPYCFLTLVTIIPSNHGRFLETGKNNVSDFLI